MAVENLPDLAELGRTVADRPADAARADRHSSWSLAGDRAHRLCVPVPDRAVPGVGPVVALTYRATVDVPARFRVTPRPSGRCSV